MRLKDLGPTSDSLGALGFLDIWVWALWPLSDHQIGVLTVKLTTSWLCRHHWLVASFHLLWSPLAEIIKHLVFCPTRILPQCSHDALSSVHSSCTVNHFFHFVVASTLSLNQFFHPGGQETEGGEPQVGKTDCGGSFLPISLYNQGWNHKCIISCLTRQLMASFCLSSLPRNVIN